LSTIFETEFNQTAFRLRAFAGGEGHGLRADFRQRWTIRCGSRPTTSTASTGDWPICSGVRRGLVRAEELERDGDPCPRRRAGRDPPRFTRRSRRCAQPLSEAAIGGILVGCLYLPNGNPAPGPKFDYKLRWFERLASHASSLLATGKPVVLAGDYNVMPTDLDVYKPERWVDDALFRPEVRAAFHRLTAQGWTDALRKLHPKERIYTFWDYFRNAFGRNAGLRIDHLLLSPAVAGRLVASNVDREVRGWEKASDHAPTWIELAEGRKPIRRNGPALEAKRRPI
jgi:exodeoxyribonuclease III